MGQHTYTPRTDTTQPVSQSMSEIRQTLRNRGANPIAGTADQSVEKPKAKRGWSLKGPKHKKVKLKKEKPKTVKPKTAKPKTVKPKTEKKSKLKKEKVKKAKLPKKAKLMPAPKPAMEPVPVESFEQNPVQKSVSKPLSKPLSKPGKVKKRRAQKKSTDPCSMQPGRDRRRSDRRRLDTGSSELALNKYLRRSYVSLFALVFVFGGWTVLAKIQGAVVASGQVAVEGDPKVLQHLEGGIISEIAVKEGDFVSQGQTVLKLDALILEANRDAAETNYFENQALIDRLISEQNGYGQIQWSQELINRRSNSRVKLAVSGQEQLFEARRSAISGQIEQLSQRLEQLRGEDSGLISEIDFTESELNLVEQEHLRLSDLLRQNLIPRNRVTQLELDMTRLRNASAKLSSRRASVRSLIEETQIEISQIGRLREEQILTELRIAQTQADSFSEALKTISKKAKLVQISAPVSGVVHEMTATTIGGVIAPGQEIMQIIPKRDALVINAQVQPQDIDQVRLGQDTNVIFSALKQSAAPELSGVVTYISADNLIDPITGSAYFDVEISIADSEIPKLRGQTLIPGMPADVFVQTEERSVFDYLTGPLRDTFRKTMRDG